ncbi:HAD-IIIC family phosphatase [Micromonospora sp. NBC_01813]|uniref:HAD-IIIC family phosphatase n=1 Tax=Micromonospora sp. NBC_01813 TaxID=2975988 RepID=UPI002DD9F32B|nr:HAD-IIIC family phosphatase [Micromonospora sp. NBC_01813]WSA08960.1 HAD-IIIC family phosphatase [Micromonospora sp. NBC_01813]
MSVDSSVDSLAVAGSGAPAAGAGRSASDRRPLTELRTLIRSGAAGDVEQLRRVLGQLADPLDVEAAGTLLRTGRAAAQLRAGLTATRIAVLGSATLDPLPALLTAAAAADGIAAEIRTAGFDQWRLEIAAGAPGLADLRPRITALVLDDSAVLAGLTDPVDVDEIAASCAAFPAELASWVTACQQSLGGLTVLCTVPLHPLRRHRLISYAARARLDAAWSRMNAAIADLAAERPGTVVLAASDLAERAGTTFADDRMRHVAAHAYAPGYLLAYARELARVAAADLGLTAKCLVLDLDETLWGGVVGDVGPDGVHVGGGYPGSAHTELQALARDLATQGVLLTLASKNDEQVAVEALTGHPEMLLRPDSFVASRINWEPKPENLRTIADQLDIGLDTLVFVDDNPAERDLMRRFAPQVSTVDLPAEPAGYARRLAARGDFAVLSLTDEDRGRGAMYRATARRRELVRASGSLDDYLAGLQSRLTIGPLEPHNADRISQLFARTNQFNLTGVRYGAAEIADRAAATATVADGRPPAGTAFFGARLTDRFGDNGLISALALTRRTDGAWSIDNLVLSCRVFGRDVEGAIVGLILRSALAHRATAVYGSYRRTDRNARFAGFYPRLGFQLTDPSGPVVYRHDLATPTELPGWIEITNDEEPFDVR